jgi:uncharacterized membrane protein YdbT with pleckstrin-like domain
VGYPRKLLNADESIVLDLHPHWRIFLAPGALVVAAIVAAAVLIGLQDRDDPFVVIPTAVVGGLALLWLLARYITWRTTHFVITSDRVIYRSGIVSKQGQNIPLERINNVAFSQTVLERLLRVGDLTIESAGETGRQVFEDVLNPSRVENRLYAEIEAAQARDATRAGRAGISVADELTKLEELRRTGVISEAEFAAQRARLLA